MLFSMLAPLYTATAFDGNAYQGGAGRTTVDRDTSDTYTLSLGDNASTEHVGRIWTDKSVFAGDVTVPVSQGTPLTVTLNEDGNRGEDFLVSYSLLAVSQSIAGSTQAPVDVVFIIDISGSMSNSGSKMDNNYSRIYNTTVAVNEAIDTLMVANPRNRVAVVVFSSTAEVLLPLDRYSKTTNNGDTVDYFTLSRNTAQTSNNQTTTLYTRAVNSAGNTVSLNRTVSGGTNIQMGYYTGMNVLASLSSDDVYVDVNGNHIKRIPSVVILSDGAPTYSSKDTTDYRGNKTSYWWAPANNDDNGPGNTPYYGNGFKALMTGAYMKAAIDRAYGQKGITTVYSIGMGISNLANTGSGSSYTGEQDLAYMTLSPGAHWAQKDDEGNYVYTNTMQQSIIEAWQTYITDNGEPSVKTNSNQSYTVDHPDEHDIDEDTAALEKLIDDYYDADNASAITEVFEQIITSISIATPQMPTEIVGTDPMKDGYVTYVDPIGDYMEVKDVKAIIYADHLFTAKSVSTSGNVTTYAFSGSVNSAVCGVQELKNILITVEQSDGRQTITIKVPAAVIPMRVNTVTLNSDGSVKSHVNNGTLPARVVYSVGLQSTVTHEDSEGRVSIDVTKLSAAYLAANTNADGTVNFYSNRYTATPSAAHDHTVGDATVSFKPSGSNDFYYVQGNQPIYKLQGSTYVPLPAAETIQADGTYYYYEEYYHGTQLVKTYAPRTGAQLLKTALTTVDGYRCRAAHSPRLNHILDFEGRKTDNVTKTAQAFYAPTFLSAQDEVDMYAGDFVIYQGNNGVLAVAGGGHLEISKTVRSTSGLSAPDKEFSFTVDLDGKSGTYAYRIIDTFSGAEVAAGNLNLPRDTITLKDGQTARVFNLPAETEYTVTEAAVDGFVTQATGAEGVIRTGATAVARFTNTYRLAVYPTGTPLTGQKELVGRDWDESLDSFTFFISPYNNAPLPAGYDPAHGITVTKPNADSNAVADIEFGFIYYTMPGTYRYTLYENEPVDGAKLPGMSYSGALYELTVQVADNGDGTLYVAADDIQKLYADDGAQLFTYGPANEIVMNPGEEERDALRFTNTYSAGEVVHALLAQKEYTDNSGENPLTSGMFSFKLEALGIVDVLRDGNIWDDPLVADSASRTPMPDGSVDNAYITANSSHAVVFPGITYKQAHAIYNRPTVYRYRMSEVIPANRMNGMTYDEHAYIIHVTVSMDHTSDTPLVVQEEYAHGTGTITFRNSYTPTPVTASVRGTKTLTGRPMKARERFSFKLGYNAATAAAIEEGIVTVPADTAFAEGGRDGEAVGFSFDDILFKKAGTYVFTVSEIAGAAPSVVYDDRTVYATVTVHDDDKDGRLAASVSYTTGDTAAFTNTYTAVFDGTPVSLTGKKLLNGKPLGEGEYYFGITSLCNGMQTGHRYVSCTADSTADTKGNYEGSILLLDEVTYTEAGVYEYYISEQIPDTPAGGITYDGSEYRYTVTVTDDGEGHLLVDTARTKLEKKTAQGWTSADTAEVVFTNQYTATSATAALPAVSKVIEGDRSAPLVADEFTFRLELVSETAADGVTLPTATVVGNEADGTVRFDSLTFTKAGTYVLAIKEILPPEGERVHGITYSEQVITAVFTVVDDYNGALIATLTQFIGGQSIVNKYTAAPAEVKTLTAVELLGRADDEWLPTDSFAVELVPDENTLAAMEKGYVTLATRSSSTVATGVIRARGETVAERVSIHKIGTYRFTIRQVVGDIVGVTYDTAAYDVEIVAVDDSRRAQITVTVNGQATDTFEADFTNVYAAAGSSPLRLTAQKKVTAASGNRYALTGGEFEFVIEGAGQAPMPPRTVARNDENGLVEFGEVSFTERGTYVYTVREKQGDRLGFLYDGEVYTVTVTVTDDYAAGKLVTAVRIADSRAAADGVQFTNTYNPKETSAILFGAKKLDSEHKTLQAEEFTFCIEAVTEGAPLPAQTTVGNTATGVFQFAAITYAQCGSYTYRITEKNDGKPGYTYDKTAYEVTVTVTDEGKGVLSAAVSGVGTPEEPAITFVNGYVPDAAKITIGGDGTIRKTVEGRDLRQGEFAFSLWDADGKLVDSAENGKDGTFSFTIECDKAGIYRYTVTEEDTGRGGVTYDSRTYAVEVQVVDKDGRLEADGITYTLDGEKVEEVLFLNTYEAEDTDVVLAALKNLSGRDQLQGEFRFVILDENGAVVATAVNAEDGKIVFDKIVFSESGTYRYTIYEEEGTAENVTYDKTRYVVEIVVSDDGEGHLVASTPVIKKAGSEAVLAQIVFANTYVIPYPESPQTGVGHMQWLWLAVFLASGGALFALSVNSKKSKHG